MYGVAQADQRTDTLETKLEEPANQMKLPSFLGSAIEVREVAT
jgi:hypothetical protein